MYLDTKPLVLILQIPNASLVSSVIISSMHELFFILLATISVSLLSLIGALTTSFNHKSLDRFLHLLVALAAGTLLGNAFFHLLPEGLEHSPSVETFTLTVVLAYCAFFLMEKILHWRHCHTHNCDTHQYGTLSLVGDSIHNFLDGMIIAAAFLQSPSLGVGTTLAIALHELPQEIGDFAVLLHAGYSRSKAILANLTVAATAILGGLIGYLVGTVSDQFNSILIALALGGFIYISTSDLIPEIRKEPSLKKWLTSFGMFIVGLGIMWGSKVISEH